jgi:hypothetical protein
MLADIDHPIFKVSDTIIKLSELYSAFYKVYNSLSEMKVASEDTNNLYQYYLYRAANNVFDEIPHSVAGWHLHFNTLTNMGSTLHRLTKEAQQCIAETEDEDRDDLCILLHQIAPKYKSRIF